MGEFFKGWRRKAGLVTLAMACMLSMGWMRSYGIQDMIPVKDGESLHVVESIDGGLRWTRHVPPPNSQTYSSQDIPVRWSSQDVSKIGSAKYWVVAGMFNVEWQWNWCGFHFAAATIGNPPAKTRHDVLIIPYWSLVLPLTLLSAWLILGKPRKAKPVANSRMTAGDESSQ